MASENNVREPIPPGKRRRLQQCFERGSALMEKGDFDYAAEMFTQCVLGDPANPIYTRQFLQNLSRKYNNNKKGSKLAGFKGAGTKTGIKKSSMQKDWLGLIKSGLEMLKLNPWDMFTLMAMASACEALEYPESQLAYLKLALDCNIKDPDVNRHCGRALGRMGLFDQAITCWHRVEQAKPGDEEAQRQIADLAVERTIASSYEDAQTSVDVKHNREEADVEVGDDRVPLTPEQQLEKVIAKNPSELNNYIELSDMHLRNERYAEAEAVLAQAMEISGGDVTVRERHEDTQIRRSKQQLTVAERRAEKEKTPEAEKLVAQMRGELNRREIEVFRSRVDRYPQNMGLKFELGVRLKRGGQFNEAIPVLQLARADTKRKATVHLELGECFQHIHQYKLAMANYETAIETISDRDGDQKKLALYRAGKLALFVAAKESDAKALDSAERFLTDLASLEYGFRDVPALLDKVAKIRNKE